MANLLATKPLNLLMEEARETGDHSLKRTLGVFQLTALGVGAIIGAGIFVMVGLGAQYAGPGLSLSFVLSGLGCAFAGLCYAEFAAMIPLAGSAYTYAYATLGELLAWIIGWDLTLEYAMGASTVSSGWSNHFIELLNIVHIKMPLWLAYDHWTALKTAENVVARQIAQASDSSLVPGTQAFLDKVSAIIAAQSPELLQRAHELLGAPHLFGMEIGFNLPAFLIALVITAILVVGIKESARFNATIVVIKVSVVLFVIALGAHYINRANWGVDWHSYAPHGLSGIWQGAAYIFFAYIGFDAVSTTAQEAKNPQRDLPIGILASLFICTVLYMLISVVLLGMAYYPTMATVPNPVSFAVGKIADLHWLVPIIDVGASVGLASTIFVGLYGQSRIFYSMSRDGFLPTMFAAVHSRFKTPYRGTLITGIAAAAIAAVFPLNLLGQLVSIGTLLAFVVVCAGVMILRVQAPRARRPFRTPYVWLVAPLGILFCGGMMRSLPDDTWLRLAIWTAIGILIYFAYGVWHAQASKWKVTNES